MFLLLSSFLRRKPSCQRGWVVPGLTATGQSRDLDVINLSSKLRELHVLPPTCTLPAATGWSVISVMGCFKKKKLDNGLWKTSVSFVAREFCWASIPHKHLSLVHTYPFLFAKCQSLVDYSYVAEFRSVVGVFLILVWAENTRGSLCTGTLQVKSLDFQLKGHLIENPHATQVPPHKPSKASVKWLQLTVGHWRQA